jgi:hypothetical protein
MQIIWLSERKMIDIRWHKTINRPVGLICDGNDINSDTCTKYLLPAVLPYHIRSPVGLSTCFLYSYSEWVFKRLLTEEVVLLWLIVMLFNNGKSDSLYYMLLLCAMFEIIFNIFINFVFYLFKILYAGFKEKLFVEHSS